MPTTDTNTPGYRIFTLRKTHGLSQKQMADRLGIRQPYAQLLENGKRQPSRRILTAIWQTFHVSPSYILNGDTDPNATLDTAQMAVPMEYLIIERTAEHLVIKVPVAILQL
jgi:transcriptional regulator with XRE-family HTH domain